MLLNTALIELKNLYAVHTLHLMGGIWTVAFEALTLIYTVIFMKPSNMGVSEYILYVFSGLVPYVSFAASLNSGAVSLSSDRDILTSTTFPPELLPARSIMVSSAPLPFGMLMIVGADIFFSQPTFTTLLIVLVFLLQIMFQVGLAWVLSLLTLALKDIAFILQYIMLANCYSYSLHTRHGFGPVRMVMYVSPYITSLIHIKV